MSHIVVTTCLILDGALVVVLLSVVRGPAVPAAAVPPAARRWRRLVLGAQTAFGLFAVAAVVLLLRGGWCAFQSVSWKSCR